MRSPLTRRLALTIAVSVGSLSLVLGVGALPANASGPLRTHAATRGKLIGTSLVTNLLANDASYRTIAGREFSSVTAGNAMKWDATEPADNDFRFTGADQIVTFAQANNQQVHGHTLVWHSQTPSWVQNLTGDQMRAAMADHIARVVGRYATNPAVTAWDVVNEPFEENGNLRNSFWLQRMGQGYIADALRAARAADPDAKLYVNDYNVEGINPKSNALFSLVSSLRSQGVPVDGVGFQAHLILGSIPPDIQQNIQRFANLGLDVKITELDIRMQLPRTAAKDTQQASNYRTVINACLAVTRCVGVTIWGFTDRDSWIPSFFPGFGAALVYDESDNPKPAYTAVHDALAGGTSGDQTPPTIPGTPAASNLTSTGVTLSWTASTDNVGVTGYEVWRIFTDTVTQVATVTTSSANVTGLSAGNTYRFFVIARDAAGNRSTASGQVTVVTPGGGSAACRVTYTPSPWTSSPGQGGFTASITIANVGTAAVNGWTLRFALPSGQAFQSGWSATWVPSGGQLAATNLSWNANLGPGQSTQVGLQGTWTGSYTSPSAFTLNNGACTLG